MRIVKAQRSKFTLNRVSPAEAFERLEPCEGKLSRTVLRGRGGSNAALLPGAGAPQTADAER